MNRFVPGLLSGSKTLTVVLLLAVLPWLGSIFFCPRVPDNDPAADSSPPKLLSSADSAHCLLVCDTQSRSAADRGAPEGQNVDPISGSTHPDDSADGPKLANPAQTEKPQAESSCPSGIVVNEDFSESSGGSSPPVWTPREMPIADKTPELSTCAGRIARRWFDSQTARPAGRMPDQQTDSQTDNSKYASQPTGGRANQQAASSDQQNETQDQENNLPNNLPGGFASNVEPSPASKAPEAAAVSASSAEFAPAAKNTAVNDRTEALSTDREQAYPSTEPVLAEKAAKKELPVRSEQLESIARQADQQTRHGLELAGRGARFAARSELISSLRLVAQGLDADGKTKIHGKSLAAGLTAMKEAEDFLPGEDRLEADLDLPTIIAGHRTPVLKDADTASVTEPDGLEKLYDVCPSATCPSRRKRSGRIDGLARAGQTQRGIGRGKRPGH